MTYFLGLVVSICQELKFLLQNTLSSIFTAHITYCAV